MPLRRVWFCGPLAVILLATAAGCGARGLAWVQDDRVEITRPSDREQITLPASVAWRAKDVSVVPGGMAYGVFVDRSPQPPGKTLGWIFRDDDECRGDRAKTLCESPEFLARREVFTTVESRFTIERVKSFTGVERRRKFHELTLVLLDRSGRRVGESTWSVQFAVAETN